MKGRRKERSNGTNGQRDPRWLPARKPIVGGRGAQLLFVSGSLVMSGPKKESGETQWERKAEEQKENCRPTERLQKAERFTGEGKSWNHRYGGG